MSMKPHLSPGLEAAFAALRKEYTEEPPTQLEAYLVARLRTRRHLRRAKLWSVAAAVTAAAILVPWSVAWYRSGAVLPQVVPVAHHNLPVRAVSAATPQRALQPVQTADHHVRKSRSRPRRADLPGADGFLPIPYSEPLAPSEQVDVYRVQLPRTALAHYGWPIPAGIPNSVAPNSLVTESPVTAELAVGSDGLVRAIRFVDNF